MTPLRITVLPDGPKLSAHERQMVEKLMAVEGVEQNEKPDLVLDLRSGGLRPGGLPYKVWSFHYEYGRDVARAALVSGEEVLDECFVPVSNVSREETDAALRQASIDSPARAARRLLSGVTPEKRTSFERRRPRSAARLFYAWAALQVESLFLSEMWNIGVVHAPIHRFLDPMFQPQVQWFPRFDPLRFVADPFAVVTDKGIRILMEEFDYKRYQGYITAVDYDGRVGKLPGEVLIDEGVHMSYPYPVEQQGELYCIPESQRRREAVLYRYVPERKEWVKASVLLENFAALDSTIMHHDGRWWLFCTCQDDMPECKLYIWHSESLFGPWKPHVMNPVKCDVRSSRPGGTPFFYDGALYRPAQDSSQTYGGAVTINRIICLTPERFREEPAIHRKPLRTWAGLHTISAAGDYTVIDSKRFLFTPALVKRRLAHKLQRITQMGRPADLHL